MNGYNNPGGCPNPFHGPARWEIFDDLPPELRDALNTAKRNMCPGCVLDIKRRKGLEAALRAIEQS